MSKSDTMSPDQPLFPSMDIRLKESPMRNNITLTPVIGTPKEVTSFQMETSLKRKAPESPEDSLAPIRYRTKSTPNSGSAYHLFLDEQNEVINTVSLEKSNLIDNFINDSDEELQKLEADKKANSDAETPITIKMVQDAINSAIQPLKEEIKALVEIIKVQNIIKQKADGCSSQLQDTQSPSLPKARRDWGLAGQGRKKLKKLHQDSYAEKTAANIPAPLLLLDQPPKTKRVTNPQVSKKVNNPAYALARRCQGFSPVTSDHLKRYEVAHISVIDDEERFQKVGKDCIRDFLYEEMGISEQVARDIRIKNVFFGSAGVASAILYAEFHSEEEANIVKKNAKNLANINGKRAKIIPYIPRSLFNRFKAVEEIAYKIRCNNREMATRIWVNEDFELRVRKKGESTPWSAIKPEHLENLPEQEPKVVKMDNDKMDIRRPITPRECQNPQIIHTSFESENIYNLLGEGVEN